MPLSERAARIDFWSPIVYLSCVTDTYVTLNP
jgi:hypothetical protein